MSIVSLARMHATPESILDKDGGTDVPKLYPFYWSEPKGCTNVTLKTMTS